MDLDLVQVLHRARVVLVVMRRDHLVGDARHGAVFERDELVLAERRRSLALLGGRRRICNRRRREECCRAAEELTSVEVHAGIVRLAA